MSYCKVNFVVKIKQLLCNCHIFSAFEVEFLASVIEIPENFFFIQKNMDFRVKKRKKNPKKPEKKKIRERRNPFRTVEYI